MGRRIFLTFTLLLMLFTSWAQSPASFTYQAIVRNAEGAALNQVDVSFRISILEQSLTGAEVFTETHYSTTNKYGVVNLNVGGGTLEYGDLVSIAWGAESHFIKIELDIEGGTNYVEMGVTQLLSVPYALHANTVENDQVNDEDADSSNELQTITQSGNSVTLSNGGGTFSIDDNDNDSTNELQTVSQSGMTVTVSDGGGSFSVADNDNDSTNELQTISQSGMTVTVSDGGGSFSVADNDNDSTNELQTLSKSGSTVILSNSGGAVDINDGDSSPTNELQTLSLSGDILSINGGNSVDIGAAGGSPWSTGTDKIYTTSDKVGIGTSNPSNRLSVIGENIDNGTAQNILTSYSGTQSYIGLYSYILPSVGKGRGVYAQGGEVGIKGVGAGSTSSDPSYGGFFNAHGSVGDRYGVYGFAHGTGVNNYGVYGRAILGTNNWAGYFEDGNVFVQDTLAIGTSTPEQVVHIASGGAVKVETNTSTPSINTMYGNSLPIAYAAIAGSSGTALKEYGVASVSKTSTGVYEIQLDHNFSGAPICMLTVKANGGVQESINYSYTGTKTIYVYVENSAAAPTDRSFSIVVFGTAY